MRFIHYFLKNFYTFLSQNFKLKKTKTMLRSAFVFFLLIPFYISAQNRSKDTLYTTKEGCKVFSTVSNPLFRVSWTGACVNGFAEDEGKRTIYYNDTLVAIFTGMLKNG